MWSLRGGRRGCPVACGRATAPAPRPVLAESHVRVSPAVPACFRIGQIAGQSAAFASRITMRASIAQPARRHRRMAGSRLPAGQVPPPLADDVALARDKLRQGTPGCGKVVIQRVFRQRMSIMPVRGTHVGPLPPA